ncbi:MAG: hypothetical protein DRQ10_08570 [Candidatus Hydrothermota bacterium]|nr:MAG: hypothetical protein DRQ10_08570 [Candidatus Hydrothermae bacterium]
MNRLSKRMKRGGALIALLLVLTAPLLAQSENAGTAFVSPFEIPVSARQVGMGEASVALPDVSSALYNPAALAVLTKPYFTASHNKWYLDSYQSYVSYERPTAIGTFGVGVIYFNEGTIDVIEHGAPIPQKKPVYDLGLLVGYGGRFHRYVALGANAKLMHFNYADYTSSAIAVDFGVLVPDIIVANRALLSFGFAVQNIGTRRKFINRSFEQPLTIKGGFSLSVPNVGPFDFNLAVDIDQKRDEGMVYHGGGEVWIADALGIRAGYNGAADIDEAKYTYGVSLRIRELRLDYAYVDYGDLFSPAHRLSASIELSKREEIAGPVKVIVEDVKAIRGELAQMRQEHEEMRRDITDIKMSVEEIRDLLKTNLKTYVTPDEILHLLTIHFEFGSAVVPNDEYPKVLEAARVIKKYYPDKVVTIEGHCDEAGSPELNMRLSLQRAEAVKRILVEEGGIPENQIVVVGKGETEPLTHRTGPGDYGVENRRVVFIVTSASE